MPTKDFGQRIINFTPMSIRIFPFEPMSDSARGKIVSEERKRSLACQIATLEFN